MAESFSRKFSPEVRRAGGHEASDGDYSIRLGERIRVIRRQKRLSLQDVEARSEAEFKASVLGAYERGERAVSVPRLHRLAEFYDVPVNQLLPVGAGDEPTESISGGGASSSSSTAAPPALPPQATPLRRVQSNEGLTALGTRSPRSKTEPWMSRGGALEEPWMSRGGAVEEPWMLKEEPWRSLGC